MEYRLIDEMFFCVCGGGGGGGQAKKICETPFMELGQSRRCCNFFLLSCGVFIRSRYWQASHAQCRYGFEVFLLHSDMFKGFIFQLFC